MISLYLVQYFESSSIFPIYLSSSNQYPSSSLYFINHLTFLNFLSCLFWRLSNIGRIWSCSSFWDQLCYFLCFLIYKNHTYLSVHNYDQLSFYFTNFCSERNHFIQRFLSPMIPNSKISQLVEKNWSVQVYYYSISCWLIQWILSMEMRISIIALFLWCVSPQLEFVVIKIKGRNLDGVGEREVP